MVQKVEKNIQSRFFLSRLYMSKESSVPKVAGLSNSDPNKYNLREEMRKKIEKKINLTRLNIQSNILHIIKVEKVTFLTVCRVFFKERLREIVNFG